MKEERGGGAGSRNTRESRLLELADRMTERDRRSAASSSNTASLTSSQVADIALSRRVA
jgi:hypothetical protein